MADQNPKPNELAKEVLYHLWRSSCENAGCSSNDNEYKKDISEANAIDLDWMKTVGGIQKKMYDEALDKSSIPR